MIKSNISADSATLFLSGRIDSGNSAQVEKEIDAELAGFNGKVIFDASELEYLSSAGLRVILKTKKSHIDTSVINCSSDIYEIFDMTGFTEMMDISKAYRKISVENCEVIGEGANGIVYRTDPDTIVKVYKNSDALEEIHKERELARKAFVMGIPTAIPYDVVQVGDLYGSVFELLNATSFAKLVAGGKETAQSASKASVSILKTIHSTMLKPGELPDKKKEAVTWAEFVAGHLPEETGEKLVRLFKEIPDTNNMIHGDFHFKNIMRQNGEDLLIDMDTLAIGHPIYEFAGIFAAYIGYSCVDKYNVEHFIGIKKEDANDVWKYTLKYYFDDKDDTFIADVENKASVIAYTRILRRFIRNPSLPDAEETIAFCRDFLINTLKKYDDLAF